MCFHSYWFTAISSHNFPLLVVYDDFWTQGTEKTGGFINKLVVTCVRSGLNRTFRVMQKPERAPIRALRASSSGRFSSDLDSMHVLWTAVFSILF